MLKELKDIVIEADTKRPTLVLNKLPYARDALEPVSYTHLTLPTILRV